MKRSIDRRAASSAGPGTGTRFLKSVFLGLLATSVMGLGDCDPKGPDFFDLIGGGGVPGRGNVVGEVTVDGDPRSGVTVTLRRNGTVIATDNTDSAGNYQFFDLEPGTYSVSTSVTGANCPADQAAPVEADETTIRNFDCTTTPAQNGTLTVDVLVGTTPQPGASVQITGPVNRTATTNASGTATFTDLPPGQYTIATTLTGHTCPSANGAVTANQTTNVDVACTAQPQTGSVTGTVTVNGTGQSGVVVTLLQGTTPVGTATTGTGGTYTISNVAPGTYTAQVTPPANTTCTPPSQSVTVPAGGSATANFACTGTSGGFAGSITAVGWNHTIPGVESVECKAVATTPAQPGASFSVVTEGPLDANGNPLPGPSGVIAGQTVGGTLDANGRAAFQVRINRFGRYRNTVTILSIPQLPVTVIGFVTVDSPPNTCPTAAISSARFKRDIVGLMPDGGTILGLRPVAFSYLAPYGDPTVRVIGLLAEEVVRVYPRAVELDDRGRPRGIYYSTLTGLVLEEVRERATQAVEAPVARLAETF